ncbi:MAG: hypothetical protein DRH26_13605 [Deltaproteobacteria bacterium]|nr:MAG: hypothetical protein DRH26_13605 [Deltaproteobacteria bacterium]
MTDKKFHPLIDYDKYPEREMKQRALDFYEQMRRRRTVRDFSDQPVDRCIIENCLRAASTAPSGANQQMSLEGNTPEIFNYGSDSRLFIYGQ